MDVKQILASVVRLEASDLHLQAGSPPRVRIHGKMSPLKMDAMTSEDVKIFVEQITDEQARAAIDKNHNADFTYVLPLGAHVARMSAWPGADVGRFRVNVFRERGSLSVAMRCIPDVVPSIEALNLPSVVQEIAQIERGLVLVTGTTGSGKSSTLAAMMDYVNHHRYCRIITVEDPVEFIHQSDKSLVAQREVGTDASGFLPSLREAMRQDPDVILVGELRDLETMTTALQAADTGHAVYSTVHTTTASQTVQRLIALFPANERELLLTQLASNLEAVISQRLARTVDGDGRVPVLEILRNTPVVKKLILEGKIDTLPQAVGNRESGMQLFDQHLCELYEAKIIRGTEAMRLATNPEAVSLSMRGFSTAGGGLVR